MFILPNDEIKSISKVCVINDLHIPFHDKALVELLFDFLTDYQPEILIIAGDLADCSELSTFPKSAWTNFTFKDECAEIEKFFLQLRSVYKGRVIYLWGNHEFRIQKYINNNVRELAFLTSLNLDEILGLIDYDIECVPNKKDLTKFSDNYIKYGNIYIGHFDKVNAHSAYTAKTLVDKHGVSLIQAHTHRGGVYHKTLLNGQIITAIENFCLCTVRPPYISSPNWQQGWCVIENGQITPIHITNSFIFNNKIYDKTIRLNNS